MIAPHYNSSNGKLLSTLLMLFIALPAYTLVLLIPPPASIIEILYNFYLVIAFLLIILLGLVFSRTELAWDIISLTLVMILFSLPLIYKWQTARFYGYMFGGFLPWSDAQGYYTGAHHLMYDGNLSSWATRRPLFPGFLAVLLSITGNNLQISLIILAAMNGLAIFLASREIQKEHGSFTATTFLAICYWYYCALAGTTATEQLGVCFGSLGMAFLIRGANNETIGKTVYGLLLLTIALNARAGAFFILPIIVLWLGINYKNALGWRKPMVVGIAMVIIGMMGNLVLVKVVGSSGGVPFSNYSYTLYGLASGNKGWGQVIEDYPGVREDEVFGLAIQKIQENPSLFFQGIVNSYQEYFTTVSGPFSFLKLVDDRKYMDNQILWLLTWLGLVSALLKRKQAQSGLILAAFFGILLSAGLVPPKDADSMRVYAATIPFTAYIASTGIGFLGQPLKKIGVSTRTSTDGWISPNLLLPFSAILLVISFAGPLLIKISSHSHKTSTSLSCPPEEEEIIFLMGSGSSIKLVDDRSIRESYLPSIRIKNFRKGTELGPTFYKFLAQELKSLKPGHTISIGMYRKTESTHPDLIQSGYLITKWVLFEPGFHNICVLPAQNPELKDAFFYYQIDGNEMQQLNPSIFHQNTSLVNMTRKLYVFGIILIGVFATFSYFKFWSLPPINKLFLLGNFALIFVGIVVNLHSNAILPVAWERKSLDLKDAIHVGSYSYQLPLGINWMNRKSLRESPTIIYEDGNALIRPNASIMDIESRGKGRFSVEEGALILSSSDNSDPRTNGRLYEIHWPVPLSLTFQRFCYAVTIISALSLLLHLRRLNQVE